MTTISYGTHQIDSAKFPPQTVEALLKRGIAHFLGNEQASKVAAKSKKYAEDNSGAEPSDDDKDAWKAEFQSVAIEALYAGTIGISTRGPAADPLDVMLAKVAKEGVLLTLKGNGIKPPKGDEAVKFPNGTSKTMDEMVASRIASEKFGPGIEAEAKKRLKAQEKAAKDRQAKLDAAKVEGNSAEDMGL